MDIEIVIDDPKAYTKPLRYTQPQILLPDTELLEYICAENAKQVGPAANRMPRMFAMCPVGLMPFVAACGAPPASQPRRRGEAPPYSRARG